MFTESIQYMCHGINENGREPLVSSHSHIISTVIISLMSQCHQTF